MAIHPSAIVDPAAVIDESASIGPYCVIEGPARIGPQTKLGPYVQVLGHTEIGSDCQIHAGAVIGDVPQDRSYAGGVSYCRIGDRTIVRENVTIHRGTKADSITHVGANCMLMAGSHVGHNCRVEDDVVLVNGALLGGYVTVGRNAVISGNVGVHQFVRIGEFAMIAALTMVRQDVPPCFMLDDRGLCVGVNRVGLQRAGFTRDEREEANVAYHILCRNAGSLSDAILLLRDTVRTSTGQRILDFITSESKRGVNRRSPKQQREANTVDLIAERVTKSPR